MATFHVQIKSGGKGTAGDHADYIARNGFHRKRDDLVHASHGNLPRWAANDPKVMWKAADKYERKNGAAYREAIIALPAELTAEQNAALVGHHFCMVLRSGCALTHNLAVLANLWSLVTHNLAASRHCLRGRRPPGFE